MHKIILGMEDFVWQKGMKRAVAPNPIILEKLRRFILYLFHLNYLTAASNIEACAEYETVPSTNYLLMTLKADHPGGGIQTTRHIPYRENFETYNHENMMRRFLPFSSTTW